jgi:hypothetical protein
MNSAKLLELAGFLESYVQDEWFDLNHWQQGGFSRRECGSVACAMGWATQLWPNEVVFNGFGEVSLAKNLLVTDYEVAIELFGISYLQSCYLFHPGYYPPFHRKRLNVVERIRGFVDNKGYIPEDSYERSGLFYCQQQLVHKDPSNG